VLYVDDAQYAIQDETFLEFVQRLLMQARKMNLPLLLIATYWRKEWLEEHSDRQKTTLAGIISEHLQGEIDWQPLMLDKVADLSRCVATRLPGLTPNQQCLLADRADGNPRLLDEILRMFED